MRDQNILIVLILVMINIACASSPQSHGLNQTLSEVQSPEPSSYEAALLPEAMWSPQRREMNAAYFFLTAEYALMEGNLSYASDLFKASYSLDPSSYLGIKMVQSQAQSAQLDEAMLGAKRLSLLYPNSADVHALFGRILLERGQGTEAKEHFVKALELDVKNMSAYFGLMAWYRAQKKWNLAIDTAQKLTQHYPRVADGWAWLAKFYLSTKKIKHSLKPAKRAFDLEPQNPEKVMIYAFVLELNGKTQKSVELYELLFRLNPTNEGLMHRMVSLYRDIGDLDQALSLLESAEKSKPTDGIRLQKALIYWEMKNFSLAASLLVDLAETNPKRPRMQYLAGMALERVQRMDQALSWFRQVPVSSEFYVHARYREFQILRAMKQYQNALDVAKQVIDAQVNRYIEFYSLAAQAYSDLNQLEAAAVFLEEAVRQHPKVIKLQFLYAVYLEKTDQYERCIEVLHQLIAKAPKHHAALNFLGYMYIEANENLLEGKRLVERALKLKPHDGYYLDSLGWAYYQLGDFKKAQELLLKALKYAPGEGVILEHLGDVALKLNQKAKARDYYEQALKAKLSDKDRKRVETKRLGLNDDV